MCAEHSSADDARPPRITQQIDSICDEFESALRLGRGVALDEYLRRAEPAARETLLKELALLALHQLRKDGSTDPLADLLQANPALRGELERLTLDPANPSTVLMTADSGRSDPGHGLVIRCPHCHNTIEMVVDASLVDIGCPNCGGCFSLVNDSEWTRDATSFSKIAHFELIERLGMGEFGTVWKARDTILERTVALKIPRREHLDPLSIGKVMREARAAAQLRHPNIVSTHEVGRHADTLYIVTEYIRGVPLSVIIADRRLGVRETVVMVAAIADALEHAHQAGVIHRDIKPSNVLVDDDGEPHLMDFGLAKRRENEITVTTEGAILGTPAYMSPEQARGESYRVDGRSDVYSLGVILFQLLTGELPFRGSTRMLLQKVINDDPPGVRTLDSRVPRDLETICLKCLEKEPARRYGTAEELATDLRRYLAGQPVLARRLGIFGRALRWARRNRTVAALLTATIATLLGATIVSSYFGLRAAANAARADQQAKAVTDTLYDSLLQEIQLTREIRTQGYGTNLRQLIDRAQGLATPRLDKNELRRQLVLSMGDFVAYPPLVIVPPAETTSICLNKDGSEIFAGLVTGRGQGRLIVYDAHTGNELIELKVFDKPTLSIALTIDDKRLVAVDEAGTVHVWRRENERWISDKSMQLEGQPRAVFCSRYGERVVAWVGPALDVWNVASGSKIKSLPIDPGWRIGNAAFDLPQRRLVASYMDEDSDSVGWALWDLDAGADQPAHMVEMPSLGDTYANDVDIAPGSDQMAIGFDEALLVYGLRDFQRINFYGVDSTKAVAFSPTNPYLAATNIRGWITVWNSVTNRPLATLHHPRQSASRDDLAFSADGTHLASSNANSIQVWNLAKADEKTIMAGHRGGIPCAAFHPDGRLLATGGKDDEVRIWNSSTGQLVQSINLREAVQALAYSPDGQLLAVGCMGRAGAPHLRVFDTQTAEKIYEAGPNSGEIHSLSWAKGAGGDYLAACGPENVTLWRASTGRPLQLEQDFQLDRSRCLSTALGANGQWMVWAENDSQLGAWDVEENQERPLHAPQMLQGWHGVAFLPDGESIVYITKSGVAEVWNVKQDRHVDAVGMPGTFSAPQLALSPDGKWLAAVVQQSMVSVWRMPTKEHVFSVRPDAGTIWSLAWDPSSRQLAVGQSDGGLAVWHLPKIQEKLGESGLRWQDDH